MYELADEMLGEPGVLSNSVVLGFPYADVEEMGSAFVVVTDGDMDRAQVLANRLSDYLYVHRAAFVGEYIAVPDAVDMAVGQKGPVCLLDMGDNVGGGSAGDGTEILHELHRRGIPRVLCVFLIRNRSSAREMQGLEIAWCWISVVRRMIYTVHL